LYVGCLAAACQVRDLRRLLELYQRWQPRVFNHCSYNHFEQTLEKMSGTHALKVRSSSGVQPAAAATEAAAPPAVQIMKL
jgi:hypothetical protein